MRVPFFKPDLSQQEISGVLECLRSGWLTTGPRTKEFESRFAEYVGARHAVAVNSCTAALHLALEAAGLQKGEGVVVPTFTFAATAEVVRYFDAVPIFADSDAETLGMSPDAVERLLTDHASGNLHVAGEAFSAPIRAIIPVHYGGQMVDVDAFRGLATRFKLTLIEDAAHTLPPYHPPKARAPAKPPTRGPAESALTAACISAEAPLAATAEPTLGVAAHSAAATHSAAAAHSAAATHSAAASDVAAAHGAAPLGAAAHAAAALSAAAARTTAPGFAAEAVAQRLAATCP